MNAEVNIKTDILNRKGLTSYNKELKRNIENKTLYLNDASYKERCYLILNDLKFPEKCKISEDFCYFNHNKLKYEFYSKKIYDIIKHHLKSKVSNFLNIETICRNNDTTIEALNILCSGKGHAGFMFKTKQLLKNTKTISNVKTILLENNFNPDFVNTLIGDFSINSTVDILRLCNLINFVSSVKNTDIQYYTRRGWSNEESQIKLNSFFKLGPASIEEKRKKKEYNKEYIKQRIKNRACNKFRSSRELEIIELIRSFHTNVSDDYITDCVNFNETKKSIFIHDINIDNKLIIEYNGSYWHNDILKYPNKKFNDYLFEIKKAKYVIDKNNIKYLIIWESDNISNKNILNKINRILKSDKQFFSFRAFDEYLYDHLNKYDCQI